MRWATSGRLTPAAATFTSSWPGPGLGVGTSVTLRTSGPPGLVMAMALMAGGALGIFRLLLAGLRQVILACRPRSTMANHGRGRRVETSVNAAGLGRAPALAGRPRLAQNYIMDWDEERPKPAKTAQPITVG